MIGLTEVNKTKVDEQLNSWKPSYHILVRPQGTKSLIEENGFLDPHYINGINGRISIEQWDKVRDIANVDIAAPLSNIGYTTIQNLFINALKINTRNLKDGIYRATFITNSNNGIRDEQIVKGIRYYFNGPWYSENFLSYGVLSGEISSEILNDGIGIEPLLIVGIDPDSEADLTGLDKAVIEEHYLDKWDYINVKVYEDESDYLAPPEEWQRNLKYKMITIPALSSDNIFTNQSYTIKIERLDIPMENKEDIIKNMGEIKEKGGGEYLDKIKSIDEDYTFESNFYAKDFAKYLIDPTSIHNQGNPNIYLDGRLVNLETSIPDYLNTDSPYPDKWMYSYKLKPFMEQKVSNINFVLNPFQSLSFQDSFQPAKKFEKDNWNLFILPIWIGTYETDKLSLDKEPIMNLPLDIYRPATGRLVLDAEGKPLNPPVTIKQNNNPFGFITNPPNLLTTIDAAVAILGDEPISAIRVKVQDIEGISKENQQKIEKVAKEIEKQTGLMTDIVYGASPQTVLVYVPKNGDTPALGWVEQVWMKLGTITTIFNEFTTGYTGVFYSILLVPLIYIIATYFIFYLTRKKEFALLLATGWKTSSLNKMIVLEAFMLGIIMTLTSWGIMGIVILQQEIDLSAIRFILIGLMALLISLTGTILPAITVSRITPYQAMQTGEITKRKTKIFSSKNVMTMATSSFISRIQRNLLSILSIAIPTMLLIYYLFISFRLEGILYTSWLGEYIAMEVGPIHYITIITALALSVLTTAQIMLQNVEERKSELAILKALGWRNSTIRKLILSEGFLTGLISAITGIILGFIMIANIYQQIPVKDISIYLATGLIPLFIGIVGTILPAEKAARQMPLKAISGKYSTNKTTSKLLNYSLAVIGTVILITAAVSTVQVISNSLTVKKVEQPILEEAEQNIETDKPSSPSKTNIGNTADYTPNYVQNFSKGMYNIDLTMDAQGKFSVHTEITVENLSEDIWDKIIFYFIPNVFTEENKDRLGEQGIETSAEVNIAEVKIDGKKANYIVYYDTLEVIKTINPKETKTIEVSYTFTVPERGIRLTKNEENYYLAQWYPMLATYGEGKWNKEDYLPVSESYHTDHSDYTVTYTIPEGYSLVSSAEKDAIPLQTKGELTANNIREFFINIFKEKEITSTIIDGIEVRVIGGNDEHRTTTINIAAEAVAYFNSQIGPYPYKQLDVVLGGGASMEYPGIVTIGVPPNTNPFEYTIIHETAHQWFYGAISNDPYHDGWIDEGITELATGLYFYEKQKKSFEESFKFAEKLRSCSSSDKYSNLTIAEYQSEVKVNLYDRPVVKLWELFKEYGEIETLSKFLKEYYKQYAFEEIDTEEFVRFSKVYFHLEDNKYFAEWLNLN